MTARQYYHALSWLCVLGVLGYLVWITVVPFGFPGAPVAACIILGLVVATLRLGVREPVDYWESVAEPNQAPRVAVMIVTVLGVQLTTSAVLQVFDLLTPLSALALFLSIWVGIPLGFLGSGFVRWPKRRAYPGRIDFLLVVFISVLVTGLFFLLSWTPTEGGRVMPSVGTLAIDSIVLVVAATMEEVVFRVLLLTALLKASGSRIQALILSSVFFALGHVPLALAQPVVAMDWGMLSDAAAAFWPELVWKFGFGFLFGALWLRTGSLALISVMHAWINLGQVLIVGLLGWSSL